MRSHLVMDDGDEDPKKRISLHVFDYMDIAGVITIGTHKGRLAEDEDPDRSIDLEPRDARALIRHLTTLLDIDEMEGDE